MGPLRRSKNPVQMAVGWVKRQPPKMKAFLATITGIVTLIFLRFVVHDHDNLFVAAEAIHSLGIAVLIYKLTKEKTCAGDMSLNDLMTLKKSYILKSEGLTFEIQSKENKGEDCTLREMLDQIVRRKRIETFTSPAADVPSGSRPDFQVPPADQAETTIPVPVRAVSRVNANEGNHGGNAITAGEVINRMMLNTGAENPTIRVQRLAEIRAGRCPVIVVSPFPRPPDIPVTALLNNPQTIIREEGLRFKWADGPMPWVAWMKE